MMKFSRVSEYLPVAFIDDDKYKVGTVISGFPAWKLWGREMI